MVSTNEYKEVAKVAANYVEALRIGSIEMLTDLFHQDAVTYGTVNGGLVGGSGNPAVDFVRANGPSPDLDAHLDVLDITPSSAVVRIVTGQDAVGAECSEHLTLIKLDQGWKIIAKAFHQF